MPLYDVFLSHASADKADVERLAHKLKATGLKPFLDIWHLVPGERWIPGLGEALAQSRTMAVFIGPQSGGGAWQDREVEVALVREAKEKKSFRIIPVLLPGADQSADERLRQFLDLFTWVDFRNGLDNEDAFRRLVAGIQGESLEPGGGVEKPPLPYRCMAPLQEPFVQRSEYEKVRDALLADGSARGRSVGITTALQGAGGFGKTALAIELCHDPRIWRQYPDGILWAQMRDNLDSDGRLKVIRDLLRRWTQQDPPAFETVFQAGQHLIELLQGKRVLLVVDDVWSPDDVTPFQGLGPRAALLVTTRDSRTLPMDSVPVHVDAMEVPEAVRLLGAGLPAGAEAELRRLAERLGEWPLLLKLVNRQVESWLSRRLGLQDAIQRAENILSIKGLTYFDRTDASSRTRASALTLEVSLERLSQEDQERFNELAIFPEDVDVPLSVLEKLWRLDSLDAEALAAQSFDLSLLRSFDLKSGTIRLHDVIRAYLLKRGESQLVEWHQRLLDAFRPANGRWPDLPREESYLWNHLINHLIGAGQSDVCRALLLDFHYLRSKLDATDVNALLADYSSFADPDEEPQLVRDALRLSAHALVRNSEELSGQLLGRLLDRPQAGIRNLLKKSGGRSVPRLRPWKASLTRPGGALIRTIDHPRGGPIALAALPGGRVVSGSNDGTMRVWDVESGQILQIFGAHSSGIPAVAALDSSRVVSGSHDGKLRVLDVESGQALQSLEGHSFTVISVAVLDSHRVASIAFDRILRVWDVESDKILQTLEAPSPGIYAVAALDSSRVVSGSDDGKLRVWDAESGQPLKTLKGCSSAVRAVAVLDSRRVVSGYGDGRLRVWDVESGQTLKTLKGHRSGVSSVAVLDSHRVVSGYINGELWVWDVESGQTLQALEGHPFWVRAVVVLDSRRVVSGCPDYRTLRVWDVESGQTLQALERHSRVEAVAVLDRRRVVSGYGDGTLRVLNVESGEILQTLHEDSAWVDDVAVLDKRRVVSGSRGSNETLGVWDVESGQMLQILQGQSPVAVLDRRRVVSGHDNGPLLRVLDVESGQILQTLDWRGSARVKSVAVLDRRRVASGYGDGTLLVWDVGSGQTLQALEGHSSWVNAVVVLDRRRVVSGSDDKTLRVWVVKSGQTLRILKGHSDRVTAVALLDSHRVVSGSVDRTLRVWDVESGKVECQLTLDAPVTAVAVLPESHTIVAGDSSGRVHFFDFVEPPPPD